MGKSRFLYPTWFLTAKDHPSSLIPTRATASPRGTRLHRDERAEDRVHQAPKSKPTAQRGHKTYRRLPGPLGHVGGPPGRALVRIHISFCLWKGSLFSSYTASATFCGGPDPQVQSSEGRGEASSELWEEQSRRGGHPGTGASRSDVQIPAALGHWGSGDRP